MFVICSSLQHGAVPGDPEQVAGRDEELEGVKTEHCAHREIYSRPRYSEDRQRPQRRSCGPLRTSQRPGSRIQNTTTTHLNFNIK